MKMISLNKLVGPLALALLLLIPLEIVTASAGLRTVALTGRAAPGAGAGVTFNTFGFFDAGPPVLNNSGHVAFNGRLAGTGSFANDSGVWSEGAGAGLALVARDGSIAPGTTVGFGDVQAVQVVLNGAGETAFSASLETSNPAVNSLNFRGLWSEGQGAGLALVARAGDTAPGTSADFTESFPTPALNSTGQTAFRNLLFRPTLSDPIIWGVWSEGAGSGLALVARTGNAAPGAPAGVTFGNFENPVLNSSGQTAFRATLDLNSPGVTLANYQGVWSEGGGAGLALVARAGSAAPAPVPGATFGAIGDGSVRINSQGHTAFRASLSLTTSGIDNGNNGGVWSEGAGAGLALVAREGDHAPGTAPGVLFNFDNFTDSMALNNNGHVAFLGYLKGAEIGSGIWSEGAGNGLALVARSGSPVPGVEAGVTFDVFVDRSIVLNGNGQTAFWANLAGPGINLTNDSGIWAEDSAGNLTLIAREGGLLDVSDDPLAPELRTVSVLSWLVGNTGNGDGRPSGFNDLGQLTFSARFTDGTEGVFVSNLVAVPEPSSMLILISLVLVRLPTRRVACSRAA